MNKILGYARVSTVDQNLDTQLNLLTKDGFSGQDYWHEPATARAR